MITTLVDHPVLLVFVVLACGAALGAVKVRGVSLGPAGALFAGLALSAVDERLAIPEIVGALGLALFTYTIGLSSGSVFFSSLRSQARTLVVVAATIGTTGAVAWCVSSWFDLGAGVRAGLFAGALTNTPALAAARDALDGSNAPVVGYSVAYPIGVLVMIAAAATALWIGRQRPNDDDRVEPIDLTAVTIRVREAVHETIGACSARFDVVVARVERDGQQVVPSSEFELGPGDLVSITAPRTTLPELFAALGDPAPVRLTDDRSRLDMRRIAVTDRRLFGRTLADIDLYGRFGAVATRIRRGDVDLLAHGTTTVLPGDRLRVVAPRDRIGDITAYLGDSARRVAEIDAVGFMVGITLGLAAGLASVPLPGGNEFTLGNAGGPLVVGLLLGRLERTGPLVWQPPYGASLAIRQLGTILFLGTVGSRSGGALVDALSSSQGLQLAVSAVAIVGVAAASFVVLGRRLLGLGGARLAGTIAGLETQPAVLAFAGEQTPDDRVSTAYALVFPVAMLVKILVAQLLAQL